MHQNPSSFGCLENSIFIFMAFFWKTVEVWEYSFRPFQSSCTNSSQSWQELINLLKQKIGISKGIFHKKQGTGSSPWKNLPTSKQTSFNPLSKIGEPNWTLFFDILRHFSHKYPWSSHNKAWNQKRNILWKPTKISALGRILGVSEHLQAIFRNMVNKPNRNIKNKTTFWRHPNPPMLVKPPRKDSSVERGEN